MPTAPKNTPAPAEDTPKDPKDPKAPPVDPLEGLSDENANQFVQDLLTDAQTLRDEKETLLERIDDNRQTLRRIVRTGHVSEKQAAAVKLWYPERQKKENEDNGTAAV